ncbi:MAG TPA: hypothetical protein VFU89_00545 [Rhabdochlamydiaceae bacterium]|nr:hypothetical protein [Rhabdochlamydiaceae bacterium]
MATINHTASLFLTHVTTQFDLRHFPDQDTLPVLKETGLLFSPPTSMDTLPGEIQTVVHGKTTNFAHWLKSTRFLEPPLQDREQECRRKGAIEKSARELLEKLNKPVGHFQSYSEQLLTHVFQDAFNRVYNERRSDERENIIKLSIQLQPALDRLPMTLRHLKYKMEFVVSRALNHLSVKIVLSYAVYRVAQWAQPRIYNLLSQTLIPRGVNILINHAPISVIHVVSGGVALVQFTFFNYLIASIAFIVLKYFSGKIHPLVSRAVVIVENIAFFPSRVIRWLTLGPISVLTTSWSVQNSLAASLEANKDASKAAYLEAGGMKAYRAWMELMQEGMRATLIPAQPKPTSSSNQVYF